MGESTPVALLASIQIAMSIGLAMSFTPLFSASLSSLRPSLYSHGSAVLNTLQQVGGAVGVAVLITTMSRVAAQESGSLGAIAAQASGAQSAFMIAGIVSLAAVVGAFFVRSPSRITQKQS